MKLSNELLMSALIGYRAQQEQINQKIAEIETALSNGREVVGSSRRRKISPEGRARIAAAQRKRWAAMKRKKAA